MHNLPHNSSIRRRTKKLKSSSMDKKLFLKKKAVLAEEAARKGVFKSFHWLINEMFGKHSSRITLVRDENGMI